MGNIVRLIREDVCRLGANVMSVIITVGLVVMPSIFAWYNIIACWNVFDRTGNLTVAVANTDEGYQSDLVPLRVNVGDQVVSALRANDQINWVFTDESDAVDGARSGRYYAAVVIPQDFSRDMLTFYSQDMEHAAIVYYANEKKSAIAPKITDQGADSVSYQVNAVFAETLSEVSLSLAKSLSSYAEDSDWDGQVALLADHVRDMAASVEEASSVLGLYGSLARACESLAADSAALTSKATSAAGAALDAATEDAGEVPATASALKETGGQLAAALETSATGFDEVSAKMDALFDVAASDMTATAGDLRAQADVIGRLGEHYAATASTLEKLASSLPEDVRPQVAPLVQRMGATASLVSGIADNLRTAAGKLEAGEGDLSADRAEADGRAEQAQGNLAAIRDDFERNIRPGLESLADKTADVAARATSAGGTLKAVGSELSGSADSAGQVMGDAAAKIDEAAAKLAGVSGELTSMAAQIDDALASGDRHALSDLLSADASLLSKAIAEPVALKRIAVFPVENFGSAMAPLYTTLALFIGSLLILVVVKPTVSRREVIAAGLKAPKPRQLFCGRFGVMALISLAQSTLMAAGNWLFLQVQVDSPPLFFLCFWTAGLVFTFLIYALVFSFANLGKAIAVLLLIVQVTGCGGSFPLQLLPGFVQAVSPWLPATHVVGAMRAAMMGSWGGDYWLQMGQLALFVVPAALLGLVLRKPLAKFMHWYVEQVESSKLVG